MRAKIFAHLQRLGIDFYDREMTGRILTRMTSDVDTLSQLLQSGLVNALVNVVSFFGVAVHPVRPEPRLALLVLTVVPPLRRGTVLYRASRRGPTTASATGSRRSTPTCRRTSRASGSPRPSGEKSATRRTSSTLTRGYRDAGVRSQWLQSIYFSFAELIGNIAILIVLGVGGSRVLHARRHLLSDRRRSSPSCST